MLKLKMTYFALAVSLLLACTARLDAQTIGYAEGLGQLTASCGKDFEKFCKTANFGGGGIAECLDRNWANVSPSCKNANTVVRDLLVKRAKARAAVPRICELDRLKFCGGIQEGDANLLKCFEIAKRNVSAPCRQAIEDAGYETPLATGPITNQNSPELRRHRQQSSGGRGLRPYHQRRQLATAGDPRSARSGPRQSGQPAAAIRAA